jgi:hypothetical protein
LKDALAGYAVIPDSMHVFEQAMTSRIEANAELGRAEIYTKRHWTVTRARASGHDRTSQRVLYRFGRLRRALTVSTGLPEIVTRRQRASTRIKAAVILRDGDLPNSAVTLL